MWLTFVLLLIGWLLGVVTGVGGLLVHVMLVLAVLDLAAEILHSRRA